MSQIEPINKAYRFKTKSGDYVYIGDPSDSEFHPKLTLNRWGGECLVKLGFDDSKIKQKKCMFENNVVKWETNEAFDFHFYPPETRTVVMKHPQTGENITFIQNELGGLEFKVILKRKPPFNKFTLPIETKGLKFIFQSPLHPDHPTWADTDGDGVADSFRPENVVGSYAVYHATRTNVHRSKADAEKYKAGKAFHIYRPKVTDANGNSTWADLNIDEAKGLLTITIPQTFLDGAVYPIVVDPTFGYTTIGASQQSMEADYIKGYAPESPGESGTATSMSAYYYEASGGKAKMALYKESDQALVGYTEEWISDGTTDWHTMDIISGGSLENINYILVMFEDTNVTYYYDSATGYDLYERSLTYNSFPDPGDFTLWEDFNRRYSIYCTYTTAPPPPVPANPLISKPLSSPQEVSKPLIR